MNLKKLSQIGLLILTLTVIGCGENSSEEATADNSNATDQATEETTAGTLNENDPQVLKIGITTMQCESCVMTVTKACEGVDGVEAVDVRLGEKAAFIRVANTSPEKRTELEEAIAKSGYSTENKERNSEGYAKLPDCCKDGGMENLEKDSKEL